MGCRTESSDRKIIQSEVSHVSLAILAVTALLIGFTGGLIGRKTAKVPNIDQLEGRAAEPQSQAVTGVQVRQSCRRSAGPVVEVVAANDQRYEEGSSVVIDDRGDIITNN